MVSRIGGVFLALVSAGTLLRFHEACGVEGWVAGAGSVLLCGMALALAFVRAEGGARLPAWLGLAAIAGGTALGVGVYAFQGIGPAGGVLEGAGESTVLCELVIDDGDRSRELVASALRLQETAGDSLIVVAYRASEFVRAGLAGFDPPLAAPSAIVDYRRAGGVAALPEAIRTAARRSRFPLKLSVSARSESDGSLVAIVTGENADRERTFRGEVFALLFRKQKVADRDLPVAVAGALLAPHASIEASSRQGPWEARFPPTGDVPESELDILAVAADEFVEAIARARLAPR
jgi:hypothetical protein